MQRADFEQLYQEQAAATMRMPQLPVIRMITNIRLVEPEEQTEKNI